LIALSVKHCKSCSYRRESSHHHTHTHTGQDLL